MNYKKITDDVFIPETTVPEPIKLSALIAEHARLEAIHSAQEPTDNELLDWAKKEHPYYLLPDDEIKRLSDLIQQLKAL